MHDDLKQRLRDEVAGELGTRPPSDLSDVLRRGQSKRLRMRAITAVSTVLVGAAVVGGGLWIVRTSSPTDERRNPIQAAWSPVREGADLAVHREMSWQDPLDASVGWVDLERVRYSRVSMGRPVGATKNDYDGYTQPTWSMELAARPPSEADLEAGQIIAYGLVLDTTGDGVADYVLGIDNDAPQSGDLRVWVTDLRTGETDEQIGPPYGYPVMFSHPNEQRELDGQMGPAAKNMIFTFAAGSAPADLDTETVRFYAWASETRDGEIVATDYAPDAGWMTKP